MFMHKEAVFGKTNYSPFFFLLGPTYEKNISEIDFFDLCHQKLISVDICGKPLLSCLAFTKYIRICCNSVDASSRKYFVKFAVVNSHILPKFSSVLLRRRRMLKKQFNILLLPT